MATTPWRALPTCFTIACCCCSTVPGRRPSRRSAWTGRMMTDLPPMVGSLVGIGAPSCVGRDAAPDHVKLHFAGVLSQPGAQRRRAGEPVVRASCGGPSRSSSSSAPGWSCRAASARASVGAAARRKNPGVCLGRRRRARAAWCGTVSTTSASTSGRWTMTSSKACCRKARPCRRSWPWSSSTSGDGTWLGPASSV